MTDDGHELPVREEGTDVLPVPPDGDVEDWVERRQVAREQWKLGRKLMAPKLRRPVQPSRLAPRKSQSGR